MKYNKWTAAERSALLRELRTKGRISFGRRGRPSKTANAGKVSAALRLLLLRHSAGCIAATAKYILSKKEAHDA